MTTDGAPLIQMAKLLEVDELRQVSSPSSVVMRFVIRAGDVEHLVEIDTAAPACARSNATSYVTRILWDAARNVRYIAERDRRIRDVSSVFGMDPKFFITSDPAVPASSVTLRSSSQTVQIVNIDVTEPGPTSRFAAIAEEMKEIT